MQNLNCQDFWKTHQDATEMYKTETEVTWLSNCQLENEMT